MSGSGKTPLEIVPLPQNTPSVTAYLAQIGRKGGLKGGPARAKKLSKRKLRAIGKMGSDARWRKKKVANRQKT